MYVDNETLELIDKYLAGQLKGIELVEFEQKMVSDESLKKTVQEQKDIIETLNLYQQKSSLKSKLEEIHKEIDIKQVKSTLLKQQVKRKLSKTIHLLITSAVAATIAIITLIGTLYYTGWFKYGKHDKKYETLLNKIYDISSTQKSLWDELVSSKEESEPIMYSATCFPISSNGYIVTNYHVVKKLGSITIVNKADSLIKYTANLVHKDILHDLAILKIEDENFSSFGTLPYTFKTSESDMGEYVYTLGYSKDDIVFGEGSISSLTGYEEDSSSYQISIPVNPGNSGGPLVDAQGNILGIISGKNSEKQGAAFAIRSNYLINLLDSIPSDSLSILPSLPQKNHLKNLSRTKQITKLKPFIFMLEVYNNTNR